MKYRNKNAIKNKAHLNASDLLWLCPYCAQDTIMEMHSRDITLPIVLLCLLSCTTPACFSPFLQCVIQSILYLIFCVLVSYYLCFLLYIACINNIIIHVCQANVKARFFKLLTYIPAEI